MARTQTSKSLVQQNKQARADLFFNKIARTRSTTYRVNQAANKGLGYASKGLSGGASTIKQFSNQANQVGNQITRGLPHAGAFFSKVPGQPMSASITQDAARLTVEYR